MPTQQRRRIKLTLGVHFQVGLCFHDFFPSDKLAQTCWEFSDSICIHQVFAVFLVMNVRITVLLFSFKGSFYICISGLWFGEHAHAHTHRRMYICMFIYCVFIFIYIISIYDYIKFYISLRSLHATLNMCDRPVTAAWFRSVRQSGSC